MIQESFPLRFLAVLRTEATRVEHVMFIRSNKYYTQYLYSYIYIYIYIQFFFIHINIYIYIRTHIRVQTHTYYIYTHTHTRIYIYLLLCILSIVTFCVFMSDTRNTHWPNVLSALSAMVHTYHPHNMCVHRRVLLGSLHARWSFFTLSRYLPHTSLRSLFIFYNGVGLYNSYRHFLVTFHI